ncbi:hypothetical protein, partial [Serratia marcescens]|uniref:hypothetical protein n=1 Tax=Serratia marcescens TaxID=615 RepID=UPI0028139B4E
EVEFCVIDMKPSYNIILGRPWLYQAGVVASSLHQMLHFKHQGRLVTVKGEPYALSVPSSSHVSQEVELHGFDVNTTDHGGKLL